MSVVAVAAAVAVAAGAALQSAVGFGFALVCAPLLYAALSPEEAVGLLVVLAVEVNLLTLLGERRRPAPSWPRRARRRRLVAAGRARRRRAILRSLDDVALQLLVTAGVLARARRQPPRADAPSAPRPSARRRAPAPPAGAGRSRGSPAGR